RRAVRRSVIIPILCSTQRPSSPSTPPSSLSPSFDQNCKSRLRWIGRLAIKIGPVTIPETFVSCYGKVVPVLPTRPRQDSVLEGRNFRKNSLAGRARGLSTAPYGTAHS